MTIARGRAGALCVAVMLAALTLGACAPAEHTPIERVRMDARAKVEALEQGRAIYNFRCYYCHGYSGDAKTLAASFIDPKPRDFSVTSPEALSREAMLAAVSQGRSGTAMAAFAGTLNEREIAAVVDFVRDEFMTHRRENTRYHTAANGWPNHERYEAAYPFATGAIALDASWDQLNEAQTRGKRLYLSACVSCHDRARVTAAGEAWALRGVSFPAGNYDDEAYPTECLACHERHALAAVPARTMDDHLPRRDPSDPYGIHERAPQIAGLTPRERTGAKLFLDNCAHCHAADGSGKNWRGSFLDPHPPDFTRPEVAAALTPSRITAVLRDGLPGTSMPAWREVLSAAQIDDVAKYVVRAWGRPRPRVAQAH